MEADLPVKRLFKAFFISEKIRFSKWPSAFFLLLKYSITNRVFFTKTIFFNASCIKVFGKYAGTGIIKWKHRSYEIGKAKISRFLTRGLVILRADNFS